MNRRGEVRKAARLWCAAACSFALAAPAIAQSTPPPSPGDLNPSAPLDPLPDLGVEWPDPGAADEPIAPTPESEEQPQQAPTAVTEDPAELRYAIAFEGLEKIGPDEELIRSFEAQSVLHKERDEPANAAQIDRRSRADAELLAELLRSQGYYDAGAEPAELREEFAVKAGDPVVAEDVIAANVALQVALGEQGFALAEIGEQQITIDHETRRAQLVLPVKTGPLASFGAIRVSGRPPFSPRHVAQIARFDSGERFQKSEVDDLRRALIATGLVASAEVKLVPAADGRTVDLAVLLDPAPMRTIAGELGYGTGEGIRAEASWQHRNFFNPEGALTVRGVAGTQEQLAAVQFRRSNFMRRDQVLNLHALASNTDRDAYKAKTLQIGGNIERQSNIIWHKKWTYSLGADLIATDERGVFDALGVKDTKTFLIAAFPGNLTYDGSDDLLDPTRGFRLGARASPEISAHGGSFAYARTQIDASAYRPVSRSVVAAGRVRLGTILGADAMSIAPSRRLYAGGGGAVRGYGYQKLGPRDLDGDPIGGRGLAEFALEARVRLKMFGGNFGVVPFLDGGTLTNDQLPKLSGWQFGAGLGVRYYSSFGPIRVDVGTPLNPREGDSRIAVTVSLGQAF